MRSWASIWWWRARRRRLLKAAERSFMRLVEYDRVTELRVFFEDYVRAAWEGSSLVLEGVDPVAFMRQNPRRTFCHFPDFKCELAPRARLGLVGQAIRAAGI